VLPENKYPSVQRIVFINPSHFNNPLNIRPIKAPTSVLKIILQLLFFLLRLTRPYLIMRSLDVSPTDPGMNPKTGSIKLQSPKKPLFC
jgi:hypothetical protein